MTNAAAYLFDLFGPKPDAPALAAPLSPVPAAPTAADRATTAADQATTAADQATTAADQATTAAALDGRSLDGAQPDARDFGPDGWPVGSFDPQGCAACPGLLTWQDAARRWRCDRCDGAALARSIRLANLAHRARQRWPVQSRKHTPAARPRAGGAVGNTRPDSRETE